VTGAPLPELGQVERAEDFFEALDVPYDREVVTVHRTQILRLFGAAVAALEASMPFLGEAALRATLRGALREAHDHLAAGGRPALPLRGGDVVQLRRRTP
jgi:nitrogenase-stabilizing/protective protein